MRHARRGAARCPCGTTRVTRSIAALVASLTLTACATIADRTESDIAGCYQFRWDEGARTLRLPWGVELLDEPVGYGWMITMRYTDVKRALTATSVAERDDHPFGYWRMTPEDSVEMGHPGGGAGFTLTLAPVGQDLIGTGRPVGDVLSPGETPAAHPVTAYRVLCEAP
jgi:hypothetical protein